MTVILALIGLDAAGPINCQVRPVSCITSSRTSLMELQFQALDLFRIREKIRRCSSVFDHTALSLSLFFSPDLWLPVTFRSTVVGRTPHVSPSPLCLTITSKFPKWVLIEPTSIAIWNKNKIVMVLSISIWAVYLGFIVQGKSFSISASLLQTDVSPLRMWSNTSCPSGEN